MASGTATLEAAFFGLPHALVYQVSWPTYVIGKAVIKVPYLGIANILAGRELVREFIQHTATPTALAAEMERLLSDEAARTSQQQGLAEVIAGLGAGGAYQRTANIIAETLSEGGAENGTAVEP